MKGTSRVKLRRRRWGILLFLVGILVLTGLLAERIHPLLVRLAESKAQSATLKIINDQVSMFMAQEDLAYEQLVSIGYNTNGSVAYVAADMVQLNTFKAHISSRIQDSFDQHDFGSIGLPLGTVLGGDFFVGQGPCLYFPIDMSCSVACSFSHVFDDAGINQTRHQIMLTVTGTTFAVASWYRATGRVTADFVIAETVIVGQVPEYFTSVDHSEDAVQDINDYGYDIN